MDILNSVLIYLIVYLACFLNCCHPAQERRQDVLLPRARTITWIQLSRFHKRLSALTDIFEDTFLPKKASFKSHHESIYQSRKKHGFTKRIMHRRTANICDCGYGRKAKVIGGEGVASSSAYPWMVALFQHGIGFICGGTLITKKHVLTAAHCVHSQEERPSALTAVLGIHNLENLGNGSLNISITKITTHALYEPDSFSYDIAMLQLESHVTFDLISSACVPKPEIRFPDESSIILGWGSTESESKSDVLQEGKIQVFPQSECKRMYKYEDINDGIICGGRRQGGVDACKGDSGGPLLQKRKGRFFIVGIASWGYGCGRKRFPGIYTRVSHFSRWIAENASSDDCPVSSSTEGALF